MNSLALVFSCYEIICELFINWHETTRASIDILHAKHANMQSLHNEVSFRLKVAKKEGGYCKYRSRRYRTTRVSVEGLYRTTS